MSWLPKKQGVGGGPTALRFANRALVATGTERRSARGLDVGSLHDDAARRAGSKNFGDESYREALEVLVRSLNEEANLSPIGNVVARQMLLHFLTNRALVERAITQHPEILEQEISSPLVVLGLPRTGSTLLQRLLSEDPANRSMQTWEGLAPAPGEHAVDLRKLQARILVKGIDLASPGLKNVHSFDSEASEEEGLLLLAHAFTGPAYEAGFNIPTYAEFVAKQDAVPAYEYMDRLLKVLDWQRPGQRWLFKAPWHLSNIDALRSVFPGARIVQTHRDVKEVLPSFCSLVGQSRMPTHRDYQPRALGPELEDRLELWLDRAEAARQAAPEQFLDVRYRDMVAEPLAQVDRVYDFIGEPLPEDARARMESFMSENPKHKNGAHKYSLEEYGLEGGEIDQRFGEYHKRFGT